MLVVSRHRQEADNSDTASQLAAKFNSSVLSVPLLYDLPVDSLVIHRLRSLPEPTYFVVPLSEHATKTVLDQMQIPYTDVFETVDAVQIPDGGITGGLVESILETLNPRWYPVIDKIKCTACLECVNYCLFGVYSIGKDSRPFVERPDSCRDGCPACARVCPSKAILFPLYEDQVIAGYDQDSSDELNDLIDIVDKF